MTLTIRLLTFLVPLALVGCSNSANVYITNNTQDNIEPECSGHLEKGDSKLVSVLDKSASTDTVDICRSYGTVAVVTLSVDGEALPPGQNSVYVELIEPERDFFEVRVAEDPTGLVVASVNSPMADDTTR